MSVQTPPTRGAAETPGRYYEEEDRGYGWVIFAGTMMLILGTLNLIEGIAAVGNSKFFVHGTQYVFGDLNTWGWVAICVGALQLLVGAGIFAKNQFARWTGVFALSVNAITALMFIPAYPFWSLSIFALDILAIYGLTAYGRRIAD